VVKWSSGLGLTIVKAIMNKHKGKIIIKSNDKKGTQITVIFPIV